MKVSELIEFLKHCDQEAKLNVLLPNQKPSCDAAEVVSAVEMACFPSSSRDIYFVTDRT
ncbi:MAG: hypothetical protein SOY88_00195 [Massilioclostridium sp.]|nr:hypothetical protein [Massilioclostridium sp.]